MLAKKRRLRELEGCIVLSEKNFGSRVDDGGD